MITERQELILKKVVQGYLDSGTPVGSKALASDQLVELLVLAGLYHAVSYVNNAIGIQHEDFAPGFPNVA